MSFIFVKHYAPDSNKVQKAIFYVNVIDPADIWKGIISWVCMPNMESLSLRVQKLQPRFKFTTDKQTGQNQYAPKHLTHRGGGGGA